MKVYLVVKEICGFDWERKENVDIFDSKEKAKKYINNEEKTSTHDDISINFWIEEFVLE